MEPARVFNIPLRPTVFYWGQQCPWTHTLAADQIMQARPMSTRSTEGTLIACKVWAVLQDVYSNNVESARGNSHVLIRRMMKKTEGHDQQAQGDLVMGKKIDIHLLIFVTLTWLIFRISKIKILLTKLSLLTRGPTL